VIETVQVEDDTETDWTEQMEIAVERVMVVAETLKEDHLLMQGARRLLDLMDGISPCFGRRIFEAVAGALMVEAVEQQRKARSK